ncbi:MAG TPA: pyrroloquinoline quinone precursor peptide PqqA [Rhizomicrobium sp.]|jgi:coenzyme PQQ precursor peptide PqqA|nr:pyrroloquinoline quinone precursor peptide PqqA [Rhizomicrobium sp.]
MAGYEEFFPKRFSRALRASRITAHATRVFASTNKETHMTWKTPRVIEVAVGMEINCYACADI